MGGRGGGEELFKAKIVNEVDAERDRTSPAWETRSAEKQLIGGGGGAHRALLIRMFEDNILSLSSKK
jgi:hypothetical protein